MFRRWGILKRILYLFVFCALGCHQNYQEGANPAPIPPQQAQMPAGHPPASATPVSSAEKSAGEVIVMGTIQIDPSVADRLPKEAILYIMARPAPVGPPLAIKRLSIPEFPYSYTITQADAGMMPGQEVDLKSLDALYLSAKIDQDGKVGPAEAGDMEGTYDANPVMPGNKDVNIIINKVH
jgi:cytochrome c-type biogenesis protein CcmH